MEGLELIAFEIISNVGMAKSLAIEALRAVRSGNYAEGNEKLAEASKFLTEGHHAHTVLIQKEAAGERTEFSLMLMHAEDQMMSAETIKSLAEEMIEMYKVLKR
ncbi:MULTISPECIES: PTS lactose/cellobiose transporter subunit IIA [Clostridia]|uniref:PTS lactose/cellobiose transporter subunit IIA n=1 Tax=Clostridia TaxID=186801 RepID=UPI00189F1577|nr:PTS lactose/cellobiose transporter subunit IIA [Paraclostridium bifermentans]